MDCTLVCIFFTYADKVCLYYTSSAWDQRHGCDTRKFTTLRRETFRRHNEILRKIIISHNATSRSQKHTCTCGHKCAVYRYGQKSRLLPGLYSPYVCIFVCAVQFRVPRKLYMYEEEGECIRPGGVMSYADMNAAGTTFMCTL